MQSQNHDFEDEFLTEIHAPEEHKQLVTDLIMKNKDVFAKNDTDLTPTKSIEMKIDTGDHEPIRLKPYRTPLTRKKIIDDAIDQMLEAKIIEPSSSPWSFPIVIVDKKDGSKRFCVDFRRLNKITKPNHFHYQILMIF